MERSLGFGLKPSPTIRPYGSFLEEVPYRHAETATEALQRIDAGEAYATLKVRNRFHGSSCALRKALLGQPPSHSSFGNLTADLLFEVPGHNPEDRSGWPGLTTMCGYGLIIVDPEPKVRQVGGFIYILSNPAFPALFKVGHTDDYPARRKGRPKNGRQPRNRGHVVLERANELSAPTGVPDEYGVRFCLAHSEPYRLEQRTLAALSHGRYKMEREFFKLSEEEIR